LNLRIGSIAEEKLARKKLEDEIEVTEDSI